MTVTVRLMPEGQRILRQLNAPQSWWPRVQRALLQTAANIVSREAQELAPRDTGRGIRSIRPVVTSQRAEIHAFDYMVVIDQGRRPGATQPPVSAIEPWLLRQQGRGRLRGASAYVIARAIGRRGIPARHYFAQAARLLTNNPRLSQETARLVARELKRG